MTTLVCSALALALTGAGETPATTSNDTPAAERDFTSLAALLGDEQSPVTVGAYLKAAYRDDNFIADHDGGNHEGDVSLNALRVWVGGKVGDFELKASIEGTKKNQDFAGNKSVDAGTGDVFVKDFWVRHPVCSGVNVQVGNFKSPFLFTGVEFDERQIFYDRSTQGALWAGREPGIQLDGKHGPLAWWASAQNGADKQDDQYLYTARVAFAVIGDPIPMKQTGGFGPKSPARFQVAAGYVHDRGELVDNARATCGEVTGIWGPLFVHGEAVDYDGGFEADADGDGNANDPSLPFGNGSAASKADMADTTPWGVTLGAMFTEADEVSARYEQFEHDDDADGDGDRNWKGWLGYTRYLAGQGAKVQAYWIHSESDTAGSDVDEIVVGVTVSV